MRKNFAFFTLAVMTALSQFAIAVDNPAKEQCKEEVRQVLPYLPGWCSQKKAFAMMDLIFQTNPDVCVEIGVFGGASIFPTAKALKCLGKGFVYAIDPWDVNECVKCYQINDADYNWWKSLDMEGIFRSFTKLIFDYRLETNCIVIRATSAVAAPLIGEIDILHIDGHNCDEVVLINMTNYLPKVKVGGYIWFEGQATAPQAYEIAIQCCQIKKVIESGRCVLLQKISSE